MTAPTPEQFLAAPPDPDEEDHPASFGPGGCDIALAPGQIWALSPDPLASIAESLRQLVEMAQPTDKADPEGIVPREEYDELARAHDDRDAKCQALTELVDEIAAIVKPSTSKVSLEVKAAVERWKNPQVPDPESVIVAHDATVEEWRSYARQLGYQGDDVDSMNRSQIRTMLGIEQPVEGR